MPSYKLTYFNGKGRAEVARLLFAKAGVAYEDVRMERESWPEMKDKTPFGSLPLLEVDGLQIAESFAIIAFLAKRFGLYGNSDIEEAQIIMICHGINDLSTSLVAILLEKDEEKKAKLQKSVQEEKFPALLKYLNRMLEKSSTGFFVGNKMTLADIVFANSTNPPPVLGVSADLSKYPKLQELKKKVESDPKIAEWIKNRPETPF